MARREYWFLLVLCGACSGQGSTEIEGVVTATLFNASPGDHPAFVEVVTRTAQYIEYCGGTLVGPNVAATAAHCIYNSPQSIELRLSGGGIVQAQAIPHPSYYSDGSNSSGSDVALLVLQQAIPQGYIAMAAEPFSMGANLTLYGFDRAAGNPAPRLRGFGQVTHQDSTNGSLTVVGSVAQSGDSGGPGMIRSSANEEVLGAIVSAASDTFSIYEPVPIYLDWFCQTAQSAGVTIAVSGGQSCGSGGGVGAPGGYAQPPQPYYGQQPGYAQQAPPYYGPQQGFSAPPNYAGPGYATGPMQSPGAWQQNPNGNMIWGGQLGPGGQGCNCGCHHQFGPNHFAALNASGYLYGGQGYTPYGAMPNNPYLGFSNFSPYNGYWNYSRRGIFPSSFSEDETLSDPPDPLDAVPGMYGWDCSNDPDVCQTGLCVTHNQGASCSVACTSDLECPVDSACFATSNDAFGACAPAWTEAPLGR